jgi:hypothetical protein
VHQLANALELPAGVLGGLDVVAGGGLVGEDGLHCQVKKAIIVKIDTADYMLRRTIDRGDQLTKSNNLYIGTLVVEKVLGGLEGCDGVS